MAKKECDICGGKIGLLGNRKLDDGNCCKDCANKLSPWMTGRRKTTVEDIKAHLAYREENKRKLQQFNPTNIVGENWKVMVDPNAGAFIVTRSSNYRADNPDVLLLSQVVSCEVERQENQKEVYQQMADGSRKSYMPPRYDYTYDFEVNIQVSCPWFNEIKFRLNQSSIDRYAPEFRQCEMIGDQIRGMLLSGKGGMGAGMGGGMPMGAGMGGMAAGMGMGGQFQQPMQGQFQQPMQQQGQFQPQGFQQQPMQQQGQFQPQGFQQQPMQQQQFQQPMQQPMQQPAGNWFCQSCGTQNTGKFCQGCGAGR